jgi:hypothetical protein
LFDTQGVGQKGVFTGLTILGDTSFELTDTSGDDDYSGQLSIPRRSKRGAYGWRSRPGKFQ